MLIRAMSLGVEQDKLPFLEALYRFPLDEAKRGPYLRNYLDWDDQRLSNELLKSEHEATLAGQMFRRLVDRRLFKRVICLKTGALGGPLPAAVSQRFDEKRNLLEAEIAEKLSSITGTPTLASQVILHLYKIDSVRTQARNDEAGILIKCGHRLVPLQEESVLFKSINEGLRDENLDCYRATPARRRKAPPPG